jgi:hypothetical protein
VKRIRNSIVTTTESKKTEARTEDQESKEEKKDKTEE